jgi:hypothetical protein
MNRTSSHLRFIIFFVIAPVAASLFFAAAIAQQNLDTKAGSAGAPKNPKALPRFEDYPAAPTFAGKPAKVNLASHPDAKRFRTALTAAPAKGTRFAGPYRIVAIGCGTSCQSYWAVDLSDGSVYSLFTASFGAVFRSNSRLIVKNDPAEYKALIRESSVAEVDSLMKTYGPPEFWVEDQGKFKKIGPTKLRIDPVSKKVVAN